MFMIAGFHKAVVAFFVHQPQEIEGLASKDAISNTNDTFFLKQQLAL